MSCSTVWVHIRSIGAGQTPATPLHLVTAPGMTSAALWPTDWICGTRGVHHQREPRHPPGWLQSSLYSQQICLGIVSFVVLKYFWDAFKNVFPLRSLVFISVSVVVCCRRDIWLSCDTLEPVRCVFHFGHPNMLRCKRTITRNKWPIVPLVWCIEMCIKACVRDDTHKYVSKNLICQRSSFEISE